MIVILILLLRFGPGYGSAPTNVASDNLAERLDNIDERVARAAGQERHFILRGYSLHTEVEAFKALISRPDLADKAIRLSIWRPSTAWRLHLSAAFFLCLVLGLPAAGRRLMPEDSRRLHKLANTFRGDKNLEGVRLLASDAIPFVEYERRKDALNEKEIASRLCSVIEAADIVVTTPSLSYHGPKPGKPEDQDAGGIAEGKGKDKEGKKKEEVGPHAKCRDRAKWFAIDEAGSMTRADALTILGNTCQPFVLSGDHRQLPPFVASPRGTNKLGEAMNRHAADAGISALAWHMYAGLPVFRMRVQLRMAKGLFDLPGRHVYGDLSWRYGDSSDVSLSQHEPGRLLEGFALKQCPKLKASPAGQLHPLFLHVPGEVVVDPKSGSKCNPVQVKHALAFLVGLIRDTGINPARVVMITPYTWNATLIDNKARKLKAHLSGMPAAATVDSFRGREVDITVYVSVANKRSGPGFTSDKQRLTVALTRHRCGLIIVGDINVMGSVKAKGKDAKEKPKPMIVPGANGEMIRVNPGMLKLLCQDLSGAGRAVEPPLVVPEAEAEPEAEDKLAEEVTVTDGDVDE